MQRHRDNHQVPGPPEHKPAGKISQRAERAVKFGQTGRAITTRRVSLASTYGRDGQATEDSSVISSEQCRHFTAFLAAHVTD